MKMAERRVAPRQKSFLRGCIYFNNRRSVLDCLVRDLTEDGARIIFSHAVNVPDIVELHIPQKEQTLRAHVKWRRGDDVGLDFTNGETAASPEDAELAKRVAQPRFRHSRKWCAKSSASFRTQTTPKSLRA
jgi:hypothetical protein